MCNSVVYASMCYTCPERIYGVANLKLTTTLINTGDETLKLLNDPRRAKQDSHQHFRDH